MKENKRSLQGRNHSSRLALGMALVLSPFSAYAHPHAWIDVRSTVVMSPNGMISAMKEEWLFDDLYSSAVIDEMSMDTPKKKMDISDFAPRVIENLAPYGYFIRITADDHPLRIGTARQFKSEMKGLQLLLSFTVPLAEPVNPAQHTVKFAVYDPTYFIQMSHAPEDPPTIEGDTNDKCQAHIKQPNPSPQTIARAFALDRSASPEDNLGNLFAEKVYIQCE